MSDECWTLDVALGQCNCSTVPYNVEEYFNDNDGRGVVSTCIDILSNSSTWPLAHLGLLSSPKPYVFNLVFLLSVEAMLHVPSWHSRMLIDSNYYCECNKKDRMEPVGSIV